MTAAVPGCTLLAGRPAFALMDAWFTEMAAREALPGDVAAELRVCLHELLANIVLHAGPPGATHQVWFSAARCAATVQVTIEDDAAAFDPLAVPLPARPAVLEDTPIGGRGLLLVQAFTDRIDYLRDSGRNRVVLTRNLAVP